MSIQWTDFDFMCAAQLNYDSIYVYYCEPTKLSAEFDYDYEYGDVLFAIN